jgi:pantoate--beta-alanine ligase
MGSSRAMAEPQGAATPTQLRTVAELRRRVRGFRQAGETVALVPTMGALHEGHLALVRHAIARSDRTVVSVFVNPKQFDRPDDLARYPRSLAEDRAKLAAEGADVLFAPDGAEMYPPDFATTVEVAGVTEELEGAHRPGHFRGVATVVTKLLLQAEPDCAVFGEKDYQQLVAVRQLVRDLDIPVDILGVPTVRESDGLALSSRNAHLSSEARAKAPELAAVLHEAADRLAYGRAEAAPVLADGRQRLAAAGFAQVDYLALRSAADLAPLARADRPARLLAAAWLDGVRLIDNLPVPGPAEAGGSAGP